MASPMRKRSSVISGSHLARACSDYPFMSGSPENIEIPNKADQLNSAQGTNKISGRERGYLSVQMRRRVALLKDLNHLATR